MPKQGRNQDKEFRIIESREVRFRAAIVGQDAMGSSLLASHIMRDLNCEATGIRPAEVLTLLDRSAVDLVIINADFATKTGAGFQLAQRISDNYPDVPIVILTDEPSKEATMAALRSGARGLFNRQQSLTEFIACIRHVRNGSLWAGPEETSFLLQAMRELPALGVLGDIDDSALTTREMQVVRAAASGKTNKAIACELHLSEHTVKNYLFRAFEKLGVSSRVELLFYLTTRGRSLEPEKQAALD